MSIKNPLTQAGIEPATFRIVAQHLNKCATAVPHRLCSICTKCALFTSIMDFLFGYRFGEGGRVVFYKQTFSFIAVEFVRKEARLFILVFFPLALSPPHLWRPGPKNILSWAYVLVKSISILIYMA